MGPTAASDARVAAEAARSGSFAIVATGQQVGVFRSRDSRPPVERPESAVCRACLTRDYPTAVPREAAKLRFELV
jgi:hypothetical protein